jgi:hypothetical protein
MKLTTTLTRYEAPVCVEHYDFSAHQRMLDLGGNSGEFAIQVCRRTPPLQACVVDLPVVCHVGMRHVAEQKLSDRIQFQPLNFTQDPIPGGYDLITCKSVLHDWPDEYTIHIDAVWIVTRDAVFPLISQAGVLYLCLAGGRLSRGCRADDPAGPSVLVDLGDQVSSNPQKSCANGLIGLLIQSPHRPLYQPPVLTPGILEASAEKSRRTASFKQAC